MISIFRNFSQVSQPYIVSIGYVLDRIKTGKSKFVIENIRKEKIKEKRNELKKQLPCVLFSGEFSQRNAKSLIQHSGFICLDFDDYSNDDELKDDRDKLINDKYTYACFISPSGNGLKLIVKIPPSKETHLNSFLSLSNYYNNSHFDASTKDICRICYESYDEDLFYNNNSEIYSELFEIKEDIITNYSATFKISNKNQIISNLLNWFEKNYTMNDGERNTNLYKLAHAFNDYGIDRVEANYELNKFVSNNFSASEIETIIKSAYIHGSNSFGTKFFEDKNYYNEIKLSVIEGKSTDVIAEKIIKEKNIKKELAEDIITEIAKDENIITFWKRDKNNKITIQPDYFSIFLKQSGFFKLYPDGSENFVFIKIIENKIENTTEEKIKDFVLNYLQKIDRDVYNYFALNVKFFNENFLSLVETINYKPYKDDKDSCMLFYKNCAIKIYKDKIEKIDYLDLQNFVWKEQIIKRDFIFENYEKCSNSIYEKFIWNISGQNEQNKKSIETTIGFLIHGFKSPAYCPAIILNDEIISENPEGGTGKGVFFNALSQIKKTVEIDGKLFNKNERFAYQTVGADTQLLVFDDVKKNFDFEGLFSVVTNGITTEKKNKDAIKLSFQNSPKIIITTNYAIKGAGSSHDRRRREIELAQHYNMKNTPYNEFGKMLFSEFDTKEWMDFDAYMVDSVRLWLNFGFSESKFKNLKQRKLIAETSYDFVEWISEEEANEHSIMKLGTRINKSDLFDTFTTNYSDYLKLKRATFLKWLHKYATYRDFTVTEGIDSRAGSFRYIEFNLKK
jgi:hypothetical protein